jgi:NADPH-dependent glutamate synthase beta subunit-like oxidoreductase/Pyruvate/2-oxoacid:ferredoxin oxidoreductase delta subunit
MERLKNTNVKCLPPCRKACPARVNVQAYVSLIQRGKFSEAVEVIRRDMPFPAICGRVCFSPCEDSCARTNIDQSVAIRVLKKVAADVEREERKAKPARILKKHKDKIAVIGSGPAGLTAAYELAKLGFPVTVYERMPEPGGMMRYCIPEFRLERFVVQNEIEYISDSGVEIKTGMEFGKEVTVESLRKEGYKAIFVAIGTQKGMALNIPGEEAERVVNAVDFLKDVALDKTVKVGERVAVIGGGNSAIDAARTAKRIGAKEVTLLYRRSREEMPALPSEVEEAEKDGVKIDLLVAPKRVIIEKGKVKALECLRMQLGAPDESGRRRPVPIQDSEYLCNVDMVIPAISQIAETESLPKELWNYKLKVPLIEADPLTLETKLPGIFAGGDIVSGPASIIEAVGQGKKAAVSISLYLTGQDYSHGREESIEESTWVKNWGSIRKKPQRLKVQSEKAKINFEEAANYLENVERNAKFEAYRCLSCGPCSECLRDTELCDADKAVVDADMCIGCNVCAVVCPFGAVKKNDDNITEINEYLCKGCGICAARCPEQAITMEKMTNDHIIQLAEVKCKE